MVIYTSTTAWCWLISHSGSSDEAAITIGITVGIFTDGGILSASANILLNPGLDETAASVFQNSLEGVPGLIC
jgi:hypothetical protein